MRSLVLEMRVCSDGGVGRSIDGPGATYQPPRGLSVESDTMNE